MSDVGPSQIFISVGVFDEADPLTAFVILFLSFRIVALVEWDMPDWQTVTTDFPP